MKNVTSNPKICVKCGKPFMPRSNFAKNCDDCCTFTCAWCGKPFMNRRGRGARFCSLDCTNAWQDDAHAKEQARQRTIDKRGRGQIQRCVTCHEPFYVPGWRIDSIGAKYCSRKCRNYRADMKGINRVLRFPTVKEANTLELAGRNILNKIGIPYLEQQVIGGKFVVDVLIPDKRIIIQWDGDFWHANPAQYPLLYPIQQVNTKRDKACNAYLAKCGYTVLRFWESDVHSCPSSVEDAILRALANSPKT